MLWIVISIQFYMILHFIILCRNASLYIKLLLNCYTSSRCGGHWSEFNGRCFYYTVKPMAWAKAEKTCVSLGGHLALVHNFIEYQKLQGLIRRASREDKETWIGGTDAQEENQWFWSDGTAFQYTDWCREEPNNSGGKSEFCMKKMLLALKLSFFVCRNKR
uniref:C-type lectin domain-containing protein n=1 Tax=Amphilophus citrinellus TaxID=61819 RepID=A0A3Q0SUZ3_AMPCI